MGQPSFVTYHLYVRNSNRAQVFTLFTFPIYFRTYGLSNTKQFDLFYKFTNFYGGSILDITYCYPHNDLQVFNTNMNCLCNQFYATSIHYSHKTLIFQVNMLRQILILNKITIQIPQGLIKDLKKKLCKPQRKNHSQIITSVTNYVLIVAH